MAGLDSGTTRRLRNRLVEALESDLVGPVSCDPDEVLYQPPSQVYGLGVLASTNEGAEPASEIDDARSDDPADAGGADDEVEAAGTPRRFTPASMGMTFLVPPGSDELVATVHWGEYQMERDEADDAGRTGAPAEAGLPESGAPRADRRGTRWHRTGRQQRVRLRVERPEQHGQGRRGGMMLEGAAANIALEWQTALVPPTLGYPPGTTTVSVFVVNHRLALTGSEAGSDAQRRDMARMFQVRLEVEAVAGLVPMRDPRGMRMDGRPPGPVSAESEAKILALQYRAHRVWGSGHNCAVVGVGANGARVDDEVPQRLRTEVMPWYDVPATKAMAFVHQGKELTLDMDVLGALGAESSTAALDGLSVISHAWSKWLGSQDSAPVEPEHAHAKEILCTRIEEAIEGFREGSKLLADQPMARQAFVAMNQAMARGRRGHDGDSAGPARWRPFQMAFIIANLRAMVDPMHSDRKRAELLFMPTGGGKTEAYLGLIAFTLFYRRLREAQQPGGGAGVAVILRYTLRLLTLDQLERATRLVCAMELMRAEAQQASHNPWGTEPFGVGLWVGASATDNVLKDFLKDAHNARQRMPLSRCPWCHHSEKPRGLNANPGDRSSTASMVLLCSRRGCAFESRPLPVHFVDEEVYARLPSLLIGTIDKFAMVPWREEAGVLFGRTAGAVRVGQGPKEHLRWQPRAAALSGLDVVTHSGLTPPELVIQDELHLIAGPLGTMAAWYEAAFDVLMSTRADGTPNPPPKIVAATATARGATSQVRSLFGRSLSRQFPPPGIDAGDVFFVQPDHGQPGRRYLGVAHTTRPYKALQLQVYVALMQAAAALADAASSDSPREFDQFTTILGYFNSLRELGGMRRVAESDLRQRARTSRTRVCDHAPYFAPRDYKEQVQELTSRETTESITQTKQRLAQPMGQPGHLDVVLSTNMISVGVDIQRLGLMVMSGPPKTISEYIQASSRVGRAEGAAGLVVVAYNVARARDRSHYEHFMAVHGQFYREVEAVSVTPFAPQARERTFAAVVVTLVRHGISSMANSPQWHDADAQHAAQALQAALMARLAAAGAGDAVCRQLESAWANVLGQWSRLAELSGDALKYGKVFNAKGDPQLLNLTRADAQRRKGHAIGFVAGTSMRDVEPACAIVMDEQRESF